ncbi:hypothetical protein [Sinosporangium album]|uniref:hypothetical protein n=1 Tax=Sinosporangium album TaxID=504805 RepID=UPI00115F7C05|nr:hypothetical protein [Sinosporangium album]
MQTRQGFGSRKRAEQAEAATKQERANLESSIRELRGHVETSERDLAAAREAGDQVRENACLQVLEIWKNGLARDLTRLHELQ